MSKTPYSGRKWLDLDHYDMVEAFVKEPENQSMMMELYRKGESKKVEIDGATVEINGNERPKAIPAYCGGGSFGRLGVFLKTTGGFWDRIGWIHLPHTTTCPQVREWPMMFVDAY